MLNTESDEQIFLDDILSSLNTHLEQDLYDNIPYEYMPTFEISFDLFKLNYPSWDKKRQTKVLKSLQDSKTISYIKNNGKFIVILHNHESLLQEWKQRQKMKEE